MPGSEFIERGLKENKDLESGSWTVRWSDSSGILIRRTQRHDIEGVYMNGDCIRNFSTKHEAEKFAMELWKHQTPDTLGIDRPEHREIEFWAVDFYPDDITKALLRVASKNEKTKQSQLFGKVTVIFRTRQDAIRFIAACRASVECVGKGWNDNE